MSDHPTSDQIEAYVLRVMQKDEIEAFERHVANCEACSERLVKEARLEMALWDVAHQLRVNPALPQWRDPASAAQRGAKQRLPRRVLAAVALALAAAVVLLWRTGERQAPPTVWEGHVKEEPIAAVICPDDGKQQACVDEAHRHGLFVAYPGWAGAPSFGGGSPDQGPARSVLAAGRSSALSALPR